MVGIDDNGVLDDLAIGSEEPTVLETLESREMNIIIADEILRLPEKFRGPVALFYIQELSYEEIADAVHTPLGTVKTNLSRGRTLLRKRVLGRLHEEVTNP